MRIDVVTLFPQVLDGFLGESLLKLAIGRGLVEIHRWNWRDWTKDRHRSVDDRPYGGGPGMVIMPGPLVECVEHVQSIGEAGALVALTPQGERLDQAAVAELAALPRLVLLCGKYEGFDERIFDALQPRQVSIGDYVTNGGEAPAMVIIDAVIRLIPGVVGDEASVGEESFSRPGWLEYPHYTRPPEFRGLCVPEVLLSGDHERIARWRTEQSELRSRRRVRDNPKKG